MQRAKTNSNDNANDSNNDNNDNNDYNNNSTINNNNNNTCMEPLQDQIHGRGLGDGRRATGHEGANIISW